MKCAVVNCNVSNGGRASNIRFFRFPTDRPTLRKWLKFCNIDAPPKCSNVCMYHFTPDDYDNNLEYEMGFAKMRRLKKGAIPTLQSHEHPEYSKAYETAEDEINQKVRVYSMPPNDEDSIQSDTVVNVNLIELIKEIKKYPAIYDAGCPAYKIHKVKEELWSKIANHFNVEGGVCKTLWKGLLDSYKIKRNQDIEWQFTEHMKFLEKSNNFEKNLDQAMQNYEEVEEMIDLDVSIVDVPIEKLIDEVKNHIILYDSNQRDFNDNVKKNLLWQQVGERLGSEAQVCKNLWEGIYESYEQWLRNEHIGEAEWITKYISRLQFLNEIFNNAESSNVIAYNEEDDDDDDNDNGDVLDITRIELIPEIQKRPILYNKNLPEFQNLALQNREWKRLAQAIRADVETCKSIWKNLCEEFETYRSMRRENPLTKWKYASQLAFLDEPQGSTDQECDDNNDNDDDTCLDRIKLKVIDEVKKHPILYDPVLPEFKSVFKRNLEWNRVSEAINVEVNVCKEKWRSIRDGYKKYKSRIKRDNQMGKWRYANKVSFLEEVERDEATTTKDDAVNVAKIKLTKSDKLKLQAEGQGNSHFIEQAIISKKLINEVKKYKIIYRNTGNVLDKKYAWLNISIALHMNVETCKKKWDNLRATYKMCKKDKSAESEWMFMEDMKFLDEPFIRSVSTADNNDENANNSDDNASSHDGNASSSLSEDFMDVDAVAPTNNIDDDDVDDVNPFAEIDLRNVDDDDDNKDIVIKKENPDTDDKPQEVDSKSKRSIELFIQSLKADIREANISFEQSIDLKSAMSSLVYSKLAMFKKAQK